MFDEEIFDNIKDLLKQRTIEARRKGGINYFKNNEPIKDEYGNFIGSKKTNLTNRLEQKCLDILVFANMYLNNSNLSLQQMADIYNTYSDDDRTITKDHIYDCLSDKKAYSLLADDLYSIIKEQLGSRYNSENKRK